MVKRVLLCDDELEILRPTEYTLTRGGFEVDCACDGLAAWEVVQNRPPDVVVTDWQMPKLDGLSLIERIRTNPLWEHIPVIVITGKCTELRQDPRIDRLHLAAIISKPFSPRELNHCISQFLERTCAVPRWSQPAK